MYAYCTCIGSYQNLCSAFLPVDAPHRPTKPHCWGAIEAVGMELLAAPMLSAKPR